MVMHISANGVFISIFLIIIFPTKIIQSYTQEYIQIYYMHIHCTLHTFKKKHCDRIKKFLAVVYFVGGILLSAWDYRALERKLLGFQKKLILCIVVFAFVDDFVISGLGNGYLTVKFSDIPLNLSYVSKNV